MKEYATIMRHCPFCGFKNGQVRVETVFNKKRYTPYCGTCGATVVSKETIEEALAFWNGEHYIETDLQEKIRELAALSNEEMARFDDFWKLYPRKANKTEARKAWKSLKNTTKIFEKIISKVESELEINGELRREEQFIPHAATWIRRRPWEDEVESVDAFESQYKTITMDGQSRGIYED